MRPVEQLRLTAGTLLGLVYPEVCQLCRAEPANAAGGYVGTRCWSQVRFIRPPFCARCGLPYSGELTTPFVCTNCQKLTLHFSAARSAVIAKNAVLEAVHRFKYSGGVWFENFLANLLVREAAPALKNENWNYLVPVPLFPVKQRERGFNQADRLAAQLNHATGIPLLTNGVRRVLPTATQTLLTRDQRAANMKNAFAVTLGAKLSGKKLVVVDDVFTTGATTNAVAAVLRAAGAAEVAVWTVARGL
jgi:competence protein ComFC